MDASAAPAARLGHDLATAALVLAVAVDPFTGLRRRAGFAELVVHQQRADAVMRRAGPVPSVASAVAGLGASAVVVRREPAEAALRSASVLAVAAAVVLTVRVHVPINEQLRTWSPEVEVPGWRETWGAWERAHVARRALTALAGTLVVAAAAVPTGGGRRGSPWAARQQQPRRTASTASA
ncbi:anthrone oxygenase family protein [uncultured Pseudokineococcus sp.]|uniref:anthrone oxygenase family protein n=1 Tax=uncultured Pseudokineococcus sp. TaxID=1642928 RepID=UPI0026176489|nr:anthrone oxygenase family protein [uncultured Pseudokineococcus sp.]